MLLFYVQSSRLADMPESMSAPRKGTQTCLLLSGAHCAISVSFKSCVWVVIPLTVRYLRPPVIIFRAVSGVWGMWR